MFRTPIRSTSSSAFLLTLAALVLGPSTPARAAGGLDHFQHGGRATAQAGAFVARADEPSAVTYNPAAMTRLGGLRLQGGLDFLNATDELSTNNQGSFRANHTIQFPPALYGTWRPDANSPWAFGLGIDTPHWYRADWDPALFPLRRNTRLVELRLWEVHPAVAFAIDERWSVGGGLRYLVGSYDYGFNTTGVFNTASGPGPGQQVLFETRNTASADVDAVSFDLAVHYDASVWGWGAVLRGPADLEDSGDFDVVIRDSTDPSVNDRILSFLDYDRAEFGFDLPTELRAGFWFAVYPELRVEIDASYQAWSDLDDSRVRVTSPTPGRDPIVIEQLRGWDDTLSLRVGVEGDLDDTWSVGGGLAYEPSPIPDGTIEPGFPRGDALVYSFGGSYNLPWISFDLGYAFHDFDEQNARGLASPGAGPPSRGTYSARDQVWSISARWDFGARP